MEGSKILKIGELTARRPIIQGGMGVGISLSGLASAVEREAWASSPQPSPDFGSRISGPILWGKPESTGKGDKDGEGQSPGRHHRSKHHVCHEPL